MKAILFKTMFIFTAEEISLGKEDGGRFLDSKNLTLPL